MVTPAAQASLDPTTTLALALSREKSFEEDIYEENPVGVFRGLVYAMVFYLVLMVVGAAGWELWRLAR
jgi:hypothetical protein